MLDQAARKPLGPRAAHERDERSGHARERGDVQRLDVVCRERGHRLRDAAVRDGHERGARDRRDRRHAWHELERDTRVRKRQGLFAAAAEDEGVAALQPDDEAAPAVFDEDRVHLRL